MRIHKFELPWMPAITEVMMPVGAEIHFISGRHEYPVIWAVVDVDAPKRARKFLTIKTDIEMPDLPLKALGTAILDAGAYVLHVFEVLQ